MCWRRAALATDQSHRREVLQRTLLDGATWEISPAEMVNAISKKKNFVQKRLGAKAVKAAEQLLATGDVLEGEAATTYRALSARLNDLAQDRPDLAYVAKELCRDFAKPTRKSVEKLKRAVRYLAHVPRLVWHFEHQQPEQSWRRAWTQMLQAV